MSYFKDALGCHRIDDINLIRKKIYVNYFDSKYIGINLDKNLDIICVYKLMVIVFKTICFQHIHIYGDWVCFFKLD